MQHPRLPRALAIALCACVLAMAPAGTAGADGPAKQQRQKFLKIRKVKPKANRKFVSPDIEIRVRFNRAVDPATINSSTVRLRELAGDSVDWNSRLERDGKELVIFPDHLLDPGTDYEITVDVGVASVEGRQLKKSRRSLFFTDPFFPPLVILRPDQFTEVTETMFWGRAAHSATELGDGRILLAGGQTNFSEVTDTGDLFYPGSDRFLPVQNRMASPRAFHPAVNVGGDALLIGGWDGIGALRTTEFFVRGTHLFAPGPDMVEARDFHAAVALADGRVLVTGGLSYSGQGTVSSLTAEIYDPAAGNFRLTAGMPIHRRRGHVLTPLPDGRVLVTGGSPPTGGALPAEIFDPLTETFSQVAGRPSEARQLHNATVLDEEGRVLLSDGGSALMELFDPTLGAFFHAGGASFSNRTRSTASLLPDGHVMLVGGFDSSPLGGTLILSGIDVYIPDRGDFGRVVRSSVSLSEPRAGHTASTLRDGRVLIVGGFGTGTPDDTSLATAMIFTPDPVEVPAAK